MDDVVQEMETVDTIITYGPGGPIWDILILSLSRGLPYAVSFSYGLY